MKFEPLLQAAPFSGTRVKPFDGTKQYLSTGDLQDDSLSFVEVTFKDKPSRADIAVREGDVLFARMKGSKKVLRVTRELADVIVSTGFAILRPSEDCDVAYLATYLSTDYFERQKEKYCSGAVQHAITNGGIKKLQIPLPPIDDQRRIAHLLGKVEGLIAQRKQHLQQLDYLLKSVFLEKFGDPVRNEKGWEKPEFLAIISSMRNGLSPSKAGTHKGRVYTLSAITGDFFQEIYKEDSFSQIHQKYFPTPNDFLLCRGNGNLSLVGKGYFFPSVSTEVIFPDTIIAVSIQPDAINRLFLEALWKTKFIRQQIENNARTTNGAHKVNQSVIEKIKIIRPPIDLQNQFSVIVEKVEGIKSRYQQSLSDLEALYGALSKQSFNGDIDLSRVPMPSLQPEEERTVAAEPLHAPAEQGLVIHLPDADNLLVALESTEARRSVIVHWLEAYREQLDNTPFSVQQFMAAVQTRLTELYPDNDFTLGVNDYEHIKSWVFDALAAGTLTQAFDDAGNRIELKAVQA